MGYQGPGYTGPTNTSFALAGTVPVTVSLFPQ